MGADPGGDKSQDHRQGDYRLARIIAATVLTVTVGVLCLADVVVPGYQLDLPTLVVLGTMILTLLGLEARDLLRGNGK